MKNCNKDHFGLLQANVCPVPAPCRAVPCRGGSAPRPVIVTLIFFPLSSQNRDIVEN